MNAVTSAAWNVGVSFVVLEGDPTYHGRLGFEPSAPRGITIDLPSWAPPEAAQIIILRDYDPSIRGRVVYPAAFDAIADRQPDRRVPYRRRESHRVVQYGWSK